MFPVLKKFTFLDITFLRKIVQIYVILRKFK